MNPAERARLVERHLHVARKAASLIHPRVRDHIQFEDLVALGNAGLVEAATRYNPDTGASFATYAWYRVQGSIIDGLRKSSNLPRRTWARLVALRAASEYLEHRSEREAGAVKAGVPPPDTGRALAELRDALSAIRTMYVTSLDTLRDDGFDTEACDPTPDDSLHTARIGAKLQAAIDALPEKERALMTKHYWEGKTLLEAGAELGMSKSWASRLHAQAVERLRSLVNFDP